MNNHYKVTSIFNNGLNLQLFADPAPVDPGDPNPADPTDPKPADPNPTDPALKPEPKYTDDDLDKIINEKFADWQKKKQKEIDEAKKLAGMSAQEKAEHELKDTRQQLEKLMKQQTLSEMSKTARSILSEKNINVNDDLLSMLVSEDADKTKNAIDSFVSMFQSAVKNAVADALKSPAPRTGTTSGLTKEQILSVKNRNERQRLIQENLNLFNN
ncbi:MAG: DUF4355 domain-containing protein [Ruminococcus sp.]|nr:DUF4355 domain-containing protein [Ruminococcus sp.]